MSIRLTGVLCMYVCMYVCMYSYIHNKHVRTHRWECDCLYSRLMLSASFYQEILPEKISQDQKALIDIVCKFLPVAMIKNMFTLMTPRKKGMKNTIKFSIVV